MNTEPVMAVVRVRVPPDVDTGMLEAELVRAMWQRCVSAELALLPSTSSSRKVGLRRHGFVAVLSSGREREAGKLARVTQKAVRRTLRRRFGRGCTAKVRLTAVKREVELAWPFVSGTPCRS